MLAVFRANMVVLSRLLRSRGCGLLMSRVLFVWLAVSLISLLLRRLVFMLNLMALRRLL